MKTILTLVERRETVFHGKPQVKLTFVGGINDVNKLALYMSPDEATRQFGSGRAGDKFTVEVSAQYS